MSCEDPSRDGDALMLRRKRYDKTKFCVKCKVNLGNLVIRHAVYCRECFISSTSSKFRKCLEPFVNPKPDGPRRTALKPSGDLLIGYSGGLGSAVLLDLIHRSYVASNKSLTVADRGKQHPRNERVWKKVTICYVEVCDMFPGMKDNTEEIRKTVCDYEGVEFISLRVQDAFDSDWWRRIGQVPDLSSLTVNLSDGDLRLASSRDTAFSPMSALRGYLASLPTSTALPTTLKLLVRLLLQYTALSLGCSHLILGTSLTSLAVALISGVCQGDGFHVREEAQEEWRPRIGSSPSLEGERTTLHNTKGASVRVIRPLKEIGMKECGAWAWWMGVKVVGRERWNWPGITRGIGRQTKDFIVGLERDYPSTVSTIVRTCGKLAPKGEVLGLCILCERPLPQGVQEWKSQISIRSRQDSLSEIANSNASSSDWSLAPHLCYACHATLTSRSSRAPPSIFPGPDNPSTTSIELPAWTRARWRSSHSVDIEDGEIVVSKQVSESDMHGVVKDFLLED